MTGKRLLQGCAARAALLRGVDLMTGAIIPTLGPLPGTVAITRLVGSGPPELLDSGATIARRTIQVADPFENVGAMLVRHLVIRQFERVGDGTATAAVIARSVLRAGFQYEAGGGDMVGVRHGVEEALPVALATLRGLARPIDGPSAIGRLVQATLRDPSLADMVGEIVDSVGADGAILVEAGRSTGTTYQYVDGVRWDEGCLSPSFLQDGSTARLSEPRVFTTDHTIERAEQLLPLLEACALAGGGDLLIVAPEVRDPVIALLLLNQGKGQFGRMVAVRAPSLGAQRTSVLEDLAVITGGRCVRLEAGERLEDVTVGHLGRAHQAWTTRGAFGILGGHGGKDVIRRRMSEVRQALSQAGDDRHLRTALQGRLARLAGTGAVVRVGAPTEAAQAELQLRVEAAVTTARLALADGAVPGGGAALVAAAGAVAAAAPAGDVGVGARLLARALTQPTRIMVAHAGYPPDAIITAARQRGPGSAFDLVRGRWVDAWESGLLDPCAVVLAAVAAGVSAAATALTTEVVIR